MVLVSGIQQSDSVLYMCIYIFLFRFFSIIGYYKILSVVPCARSSVILMQLLMFEFLRFLNYPVNVVFPSQYSLWKVIVLWKPALNSSPVFSVTLRGLGAVFSFSQLW